MAQQFPRREQRKAASRRSLIRSSRVLFAQKGYEATTLEEIAAHAGLHVQTLYRHFSNKPELAAAGDAEVLHYFKVAIRDPQRSTNTFQFWRQWIADAVATITRDDGGETYRTFLNQRFGTPTIATETMRIARDYEDLLTESLEKDFNTPATTGGLSMARMAAIALWGANIYVIHRLASGDDIDLASEAVAAVDAVAARFADQL